MKKYHKNKALNKVLHLLKAAAKKEKRTFTKKQKKLFIERLSSNQ